MLYTLFSSFGFWVFHLCICLHPVASKDCHFCSILRQGIWKDFKCSKVVKSNLTCLENDHSHSVQPRNVHTQKNKCYEKKKNGRKTAKKKSVIFSLVWKSSCSILYVLAYFHIVLPFNSYTILNVDKFKDAVMRIQATIFKTLHK